MFRTKVTFWDAVAAAAVLLTAVILLLLPLLSRDTARILVVTTPEGSAAYALSGDREVTLTSRGVTLTVKIEDGAASVTYSTCPDKVCVAGGSISRVGESILCAPAGVTLTVKGGEGDVDFVAG